MLIPVRNIYGMQEYEQQHLWIADYLLQTFYVPPESPITYNL